MRIGRAVGGSGTVLAWVAVAATALASAGCRGGGPEAVDDPGKLTITLRSPAFADDGMIPREYTCDGAGGSPPLEWSGVPKEARELALVVDDPDAPMGTFAHWVVAHLPPRATGLKAGVPAAAELPPTSVVAADGAEVTEAAAQGENDFSKPGYGGPCPPSGTHRYVFRLYALDAPLDVAGAPLTRSAALRAIEGHILAEGRLIGRYARE